MAVHLIADINIKDRDVYKEYVEKAKPIVEKFGGEYVLASERVMPYGGDWKPQKILIIKFESIGKLSECFKSEEYLQIASLRERSSTSNSVIVL